MPTITSFHSSVVEPGDVNGIMADYLALERARRFRGVLVQRCGALAAGIVLLGTVLRILPPIPTWFSLGAFVALPVSAWIVELRRERRLANRLDRVRKGVVHTVVTPAARKS